MIITSSFKKYNNPKGFTLVELLISLAIFTSVITIATGALYSAQAINARLEQTQLVLDGVNLTVEVMAREIRYGSQFHCDTVIPQSSVPTTPASCAYSNGGTVIVLKPSVGLPNTSSSNSDRIAYYLSEGVIYKDEYKEGNIANKITYQITPSDVTISSFTLYVVGSENTSLGDTRQPIVTLVISGQTIPARVNISPVEFTIQTSVSSRALDI